MTNSIRTPRQGVTANSRRIAQAVDNEEWQVFRVSLKGKSTEDKLSELRRYWNANSHGHTVSLAHKRDVLQYDCDICIRVDNYIKALCRGGQLLAGENIYTVLEAAWRPRIKK